MTATLEQAALEKPAGRGFAHFVRPVLGLLLPVVLAAGWEIAVSVGWSNGRLVPPPSVIFKTLFGIGAVR
jgi:sulfonate transport system permease protein